MKKSLRLFVATVLMLTVYGAYAQDKRNMFNPVNHAVISQIIAPDARSAGMGDVGAATDPDVNSQYWNPAKYPFNISRAGVAINYTPWLRQLVNDMDMAYVAGYYRIGDYSAVSASLRYFSLGEVFISSDASGSNDMTIKPIHSDMRYDYSEDSSPASAFAADIAGYYQNYINLGNRECQLGLGLNISNIGSKIKFSGDEDSEFIPTNMRLGAALMVPLDEFNKLTIAADANKLLVPTVPKQEEGEATSDYIERVRREYNDVSSISGIFKSFHDAPGGFKEEMDEIQWSVGAEYTYNEKFSLRAGYHHEAENKGNRQYFTVGGGFKMNVFSLDDLFRRR